MKIEMKSGHLVSIEQLIKWADVMTQLENIRHKLSAERLTSFFELLRKYEAGQFTDNDCEQVESHLAYAKRVE